MRFSRRARLALLGLTATALLLVISHPIWLGWLGSYLVLEERPYAADAIVVLGGDLRGARILTAAALAREGYAPTILVSGSGPIYGLHESQLAVAWAVSKGYPESLFQKLPFPANSTEEETRGVVKQLRGRRIKRFLLVTSNFHTRRAALTFRQEAPELSFHVIASPDLYFTPGGWWKSREGQKTFLIEWTKTFAHWLGD